MDATTFSFLQKDVYEALANRHLSTALSLLNGLATGIGQWTIQVEIEELSNSYGLLLDYMGRGNSDPYREQMYSGFLRQSYELTDQLEREFKKESDSSLYYSTLRTLEKGSITLATLIGKLENLAIEFSERKTHKEPLEQSHAELCRQLFEWAWTSARWGKNDAEMVQAFLDSPIHRTDDKALLISGITLGALQCFDARKVHGLLTHVDSDDKLLAARCLVGSVFVILRFSERLELYPDLKAQLSLLRDNPSFCSSIANLQMQLIMTQETKTIEKKLREDIIPSMMRNQQFAKSKFGLEELGMDSGEDKNPDWKDSEEVKQMERKMMELAELQTKGADVYMGTFSALKQRYPFFSIISNWFCPYSETNPEVAKMNIDSSVLQKMLHSSMLCDSDKYSFVLMLAGMPFSQMELMRTQLDALTEQSEELTDQALPQKNDAETYRRLYLQDLYRFFKLFRYGNEMIDPFKLNLLLIDCDYFKEFFEDEKGLLELAEFSFSQRNYLTALRFYSLLSEQFGISGKTLQKQGFCYQQLKLYDKAIESYEQSLVLVPDSAWTQRHLAQSYQAVGNYECALKCYQTLEKTDGDNLSLLLRLAECLIRLERYEEAFPPLFKINYFDEKSGKASRAIAWCSFLSGKLEQAQKYYQKLVEASPQSEDLKNAGHVAWSSGQVPEALNFYVACVKMESKEQIDDSFFKEDESYLHLYNITTNDMRLMTDIINRRLS